MIGCRNALVCQPSLIYRAGFSYASVAFVAAR